MTKLSEREPYISNLKVSFKVERNLKSTAHKLDSNKVKLHHNYAIIRHCDFVYSINYSGYVNITKLRTEGDIGRAITEICILLDLVDRPPSYRIDNITASGHFGRTVRLNRLGEYFQKSDNGVVFSFRPSYFCGANIKFGFGTIIIFHTGSFTIVGSKNREQVKQVFAKTKQILAEADQYV